jgi:uncharacterized protein (DUF58 family)
MLTSRGWWHLLLVFALLAAGLLGQYGASALLRAQPVRLSNLLSVVLLGLTLGLWFSWEWLLFALRMGRARRTLSVVRTASDDRGSVETLWAGRTFEVQVEVVAPIGLRIGHAVLDDRVPFGVEFLSGAVRYEGEIDSRTRATLSYIIRCPAAGLVRFEGLRAQFSDLQGFFHHETFLPAVTVFRVLPPLADIRGHSPTVKRSNLLPPPGQHRHRRPGSGSELLDLRDYMPGDPPKTIAWKVSARRDRLITKEFESEVPLRCTLFVDTSNSVRLGPAGQNALAGLVQIAAAVAQACAGTRDLVGLCLFDEHGATRTAPARGARHLVNLLNQLSGAAVLAPSTGQPPLDRLLPVAYGFAQEVYPELLDSEVNHVPFWLPWLVPQPAYTIRGAGLADRLYRWLPVLLPLYGIAGIGAVVLACLGALWVMQALGIPLSISLLLTVVVVLAMPLIYVRVPPTLFFPARRRRTAWRKRLAALFSVRYGLGPGGLGLLLEDDERCSRYLQRFLSDHQVPYDLPLYDREGAYTFAAPAKVKVLAESLVQAIGKGRDNELYVLLADLLELSDALEPLLRSVKVALARHHRVVVVCSWPPEIPPPAVYETEKMRQAEGTADVSEPFDASVRAVLQRTTRRRFHRAFEEVRRAFGRIRVPVLCARTGDPPRIILDRLEVLRGLGRRR